MPRLARPRDRAVASGFRTIGVGASFGAWIALEVAIKSVARIDALVLAGAVGAKFGARESSDIVDIFAVPQARFETLAYHDAQYAKRDYGALTDEELAIV